MAEICVAHLVRAQNGLGPFRDFIESYRAHPAGVGHALLIIFKGFGERPDLNEYEPLLTGISCRPFFVRDEGFDIMPYFSAAVTFEYRYFFFLNSFSVILDEGWLAKIYEHARREDVGVVGATGSWQSLYSGAMYEAGKPSAYDAAYHRDHSFRRRPALFELSEGLKEKIRG